MLYYQNKNVTLFTYKMLEKIKGFRKIILLKLRNPFFIHSFQNLILKTLTLHLKPYTLSLTPQASSLTPHFLNKCNIKYFLHVFYIMKCHTRNKRTINFLNILFVLPTHDNFLQPCTLCGQNFLFNTSYR